MRLFRLFLNYKLSSRVLCRPLTSICFTNIVQEVTQAYKKKIPSVDTYSSRRPYYLAKWNLIYIPIALKNRWWHICITKQSPNCISDPFYIINTRVTKVNQ